MFHAQHFRGAAESQYEGQAASASPPGNHHCCIGFAYNFSYQILHQASLVVAVDRSKFKSCSQSGFCKRCRAVQPGVSTYQVKQKGEYYI